MFPPESVLGPSQNLISSIIVLINMKLWLLRPFIRSRVRKLFFTKDQVVDIFGLQTTQSLPELLSFAIVA